MAAYHSSTEPPWTAPPTVKTSAPARMVFLRPTLSDITAKDTRGGGGQYDSLEKALSVEICKSDVINKRSDAGRTWVVFVPSLVWPCRGLKKCRPLALHWHCLGCWFFRKDDQMVGLHWSRHIFFDKSDQERKRGNHPEWAGRATCSLWPCEPGLTVGKQESW